VNKHRLLCAASAYIMHEFNNQTIERLRNTRFFKLILPPFSNFLRNNVQKEIEKDHAVIFAAYQAYDMRMPPGEDELRALLQQAQEIDRKFIRQAHMLPVSIHIPYEDIEDIRRERMRHLLENCYRLFLLWEQKPRLRKAVQTLFDRNQFNSFILRVLMLYVSETRILSNSIKLPHRLGFARDLVLHTITSAMQTVAAEVAAECTRIIYGRT